VGDLIARVRKERINNREKSESPEFSAVMAQVSYQLVCTLEKSYQQPLFNLIVEGGMNRSVAHADQRLKISRGRR
jgi:hypothetical protein